MFCPKLCRTTCPVSNASPRETLTPWGKMSTAYFAANGSVALAEPFGAPSWACTGCFGCREGCDHRNDVTGTLFAARSALSSAGIAPEPARRVASGFSRHAEMLHARTRALASATQLDAGGRTALLVGCAYLRMGEGEARDAIRATKRLAGGPVALVDVCCGAPLLHAGARAEFEKQGERLAASVLGKDKLVVLDAGCASTIRVHLSAAGIGMQVPVEVFVELAARERGTLGVAESFASRRVRYHDPCQLGRGLGLFDEPRAVLSRALGRAPEEFERHHEDARCSGAGGLLPVTMPDVAKAIAERRLAEHEARGGGTVVTACASSLRMFRARRADVVDLVSVVARALQ